MAKSTKRQYPDGPARCASRRRRRPWRAAIVVAVRSRCRRRPRRRWRGPRGDVQVGRREGRRPLHGQDAARGRQQGQRRAQQAGRAGQAHRAGADAGAAPREGAGSRARSGRSRGRRRRSLAATARSSPRTRARARSISRATASLQTINSVMLSSQAYSDTARQAQGRARGEEGDSQGKPVAAVLERELESIDAELAEAGRPHRRRRRRESAAITARYDADKQRWRELVAAKAEHEVRDARRRRGRSSRRRHRQEVEPREGRPARDVPGAALARRLAILTAARRGAPAIIAAPNDDSFARQPMAQYVYTMNRVGKIVPPKRVILKDISLSFFPGAKIGVLGLNGSGKSSLLRIMAGEDKEFEGEAVPMPDMRIGFLPQEPQLDPAQDRARGGRGGPGRGPRGEEEARRDLRRLRRARRRLRQARRRAGEATKRSSRRRAPTPTCRWRSPPTRCGCRRGTRRSASSPAARSAASRCAGCCCRSPTCCCSTSRPTTSTPRASSGSSSSCRNSPAPWSR